jgi:hypothetical protein
MNELAGADRAAERRRLKGLVLDSVSSPITQPTSCRIDGFLLPVFLLACQIFGGHSLTKRSFWLRVVDAEYKLRVKYLGAVNLSCIVIRVCGIPNLCATSFNPASQFHD